MGEMNEHRAGIEVQQLQSSAERQYLRLLNRSEYPRTADDLPLQLTLEENLFGLMPEAALDMGKERHAGRERAGYTGVNRDGSLQAPKGYIEGTEGKVSLRSVVQQVRTEEIETPLLVWHTDPGQERDNLEDITMFSENDIREFLHHLELGHILAVASRNGVEIICRTRTAESNAIQSNTKLGEKARTLYQLYFGKLKGYEKARRSEKINILKEMGLGLYSMPRDYTHLNDAHLRGQPLKFIRQTS